MIVYDRISSRDLSTFGFSFKQLSDFDELFAIRVVSIPMQLIKTRTKDTASL